jgi:succinylglutamate desuccinylase
MEWIKIFKSWKKWPTTLIVWLVHWNETVWKYVLDNIEKIALWKQFLWELITLVWNPLAYKLWKRFIDMDLNRSFWEFLNQNYEQQRANEIKKYFSLNKIKVDYVFDFHSTPTKSEEMIICTNNPESIKLSQLFPINKVILWLTDIIEWLSLSKYFSELWAIDFAFECWQHGTKDNIDLVDNIININGVWLDTT